MNAVKQTEGRPGAGLRPLRTGLLLALAGVLGASAMSVPPARAQARSEFVPTFSTNTRVRQQVDRLGRLATQKLWDEYLATYQQLVDNTEDWVMARDEEFLVGIRYYAHQALAAQPAAVRQRYRALQDAPARRLYDKALAEKDGAAMREVYSRYRFSSHAGKALLWIANNALDSGRPEVARVAYSRLAGEPGAGAAVLLRYALAADAAGKPAEARAVLERVRKEAGGQPVQLAGQNLTGAAAADAVAKSLRPAAPSAGTRWSGFAGDNADRRMAGTLTGGVKRLWEFTQPTQTDVVPAPGRSTQFVIPGYGAQGRFRFLTFPAVGDNRLWVQGPRNLTAVDLTTGKAVWDRQDFNLEPGAAARPAGDVGFRGSYNPRGVRSVQAAPAVEAHRLITRLPLGGQGSQWPADYAIAVSDARTGAPLWRRTAGGEPRGTYFNIPAMQSGMVFTGVVTSKGGITEYNAVALDAGTGEPLWSTYLGAGSDPTSYVDGSPAAVKDGLVWIESSLYTLNALDLITGEVRLIYRYEPTRRSTFRGGFEATPQVANEPISLIASGAGPIVFAPRWGLDVVALDPATGKLLWSSPKGPGQAALGSLFAVDGKYAYICGDHLQAINLKDGAREWTWEPQAVSSGVGYAALVGDRIYVPVEGTIHVRAAADGRELEVLDVKDVLTDSPGFMSLTVVDQLLLAATRDKVVAFGPK